MTKSATTTPNRQANNKSAPTSSQTKMKQASLLSFFAKKPVLSSQDTKGSLISPSSTPSPEKDVEGNNNENWIIEKKTAIREEKKSPAVPSPASIIKRPAVKEQTNNWPSVQTTSSDGDEDKPIHSSPTNSRRRPKVTYSEISDDDELDGHTPSVSKSQLKRRRIADDEGSEDEFIPEEKEESDDDMADFVVPDDHEEDKVKNEEDDDLDDDDLIELTSVKQVKSPAPVRKFEPKITNSSHGTTPRKSLITPTKQKPSPKPTKSEKFTKENEERYQWLVDIRDAEKRAETDPNYDPRSLYIPSSAWSKFTAFEKQYWEIKSKMWDSVVFFKKGKFYELYEKDAMIAHNEFDLKIAGGGRANMQLAGIPEMSFDYWATSFISKGYKVAKVDQVETGLAKEIREANGGAKSKKEVIQRELKCVLTAGTLTDETMLTDDMATYCIAIKEDNDFENPSGKVFGVAFIDTSTGIINLTEFKDDSECTKFETLISQIRPKESIIARGNLSPLASRILKFNSQSNAIFNVIKPDTEFYDFDTTFETLTRGGYFEAENLDDLSKWPIILRDYYKEEKHVGFSAFGGLLWYLKSLKLDQSLISLGHVASYTTIKPSTNLVLDGQTLQNLEIFANSFDGTEKGTLFKLVNRATTPFGKRLLKTWVVHPLLAKQDIEKRLDSVDQLLDSGDLKSTIESSLSKLPDLERLLSRIHAGQLKLKDFTRAIEGFEDITALHKRLESFELKGALGELFEKFPDSLYECLDKWSDAFDRVQAKENDILILSDGLEPDYDESKANIGALESQLNTKLREYRKEFKTQSIEYKDFGKELYTIEMSAAIKVPNSWTQMGSSKKTKRWWSPEVEKLSKEIARAQETHKIIEESLKTRMLKRFDNDYQVWINSINLISKIDCLAALAKTSESIGFPATRPEFVESETGLLEFTELRHPCFNLGSTSAKDFIPNDIKLGGSSPNMGLLTGANAAGKSTVLRMTCVAVILAQIGCYVPAETARISPVDRIMTRLGANDNIMQGKSTFYVELSETKRILENSTPKSLLVLDELGRGGSSSDGFAIAEAVLHHVATHIQSLGFFATHYGSLGASFANHPQVQPFTMAIIVNDESKNITFLYKLEEGKAAGSFGMHVARMCGIDKEIIKSSEIAAEEFEHTSKLKKNAKDILDLIPVGLQSDIARLVTGGITNNNGGCGDGSLLYGESMKKNALKSIFGMIEGL